MSRKTMLINATDSEEIRVATLLDGVLSDFDVEFVHNEKIKGNIYKAKVVRVDTSLQAAFIHYGGTKNGFLPIGELPRDLVSPDGRRGRIQDLLHRDQEIMVQAVREEMGAKGAMMTAQVSLPGRYLVLTPGNPMNGISRKIESREEREYFKKLIDEMEIPKNFGVIVRTASLGVTKEDFQRDLEYLLDTYKEVLGRYKHRQGPGLVWQEDDVVTRTLRDCFSADIEEVHVDDLETFHAAQGFFKRTMPQHAHVLKHYVGKKPLFSRFQTEEQIDRIYARRVALPSGGALVLDQTEALVAVDVNSGKTTGDNQEDTAYKTNLEAAEEVARQLRLRDLAGLVVIDFIDMKREAHIKAVQDRLVEGLREDKARMEVGKINRFGVLVLTRQRIRPSIEHVSHETCPTCQGSGKVKTLEAMVLSVVRRLKAILSRGGVAQVRVKLAPAIALAVLNNKRAELAELESQFEGSILIQADPEALYGEMAAEIERREDEPAAEKPQPRAPREHRGAEDETVILGGDAPISFERALGEERKGTAPVGLPDVRQVRRDSQRAALEERERMRALFESALPEDEATDEASPAAEPKGERERSGRRRRRGRGGAGAAEAAAPVAAAPVAAEPVVEVRADAARPTGGRTSESRTSESRTSGSRTSESRTSKGRPAPAPKAPVALEPEKPWTPPAIVADATLPVKKAAPRPEPVPAPAKAKGRGRKAEAVKAEEAPAVKLDVAALLASAALPAVPAKPEPKVEAQPAAKPAKAPKAAAKSAKAPKAEAQPAAPKPAAPKPAAPKPTKAEAEAKPTRTPRKKGEPASVAVAAALAEPEKPVKAARKPKAEPQPAPAKAEAAPAKPARRPRTVKG